MLVRVYPFLELFQVIALAALYLSRHYGLALINLFDDVMDHDACFVVLEFSGLEVVKGSLNGMTAIVFTYIVDTPLVQTIPKICCVKDKEQDQPGNAGCRLII